MLKKLRQFWYVPLIIATIACSLGSAPAPVEEEAPAAETATLVSATNTSVPATETPIPPTMTRMPVTPLPPQVTVLTGDPFLNALVPSLNTETALENSRSVTITSKTAQYWYGFLDGDESKAITVGSTHASNFESVFMQVISVSTTDLTSEDAYLAYLPVNETEMYVHTSEGPSGVWYFVEYTEELICDTPLEGDVRTLVEKSTSCWDSTGTYFVR